MRLRRSVLLLALLLPIAPAQAVRTATALTAAPLLDRPAPDAKVIATLPAGVTVTLEQCTGSTSAATGAASAGAALAPPPPGAFCLLRGLGWVDAAHLGNVSADPTGLFAPDGLLDPLKNATPSWDDLSDPND